MDQDASSSGGWRFAQCFGDKGEVEDITEGRSGSFSPAATFGLASYRLLHTPQPTSSRPSSLTRQETTSPQVIRVAASSCSNAMRWYVACLTAPARSSNQSCGAHSPHLTQNRKRAANISSTRSSSRMSPNSTTSSHWRSRRRSTRSSGASDRTLHTSSCPLTVRHHPSPPVSYMPISPIHRQDDQAMESVRKVITGGVREQPP